MLKNVTMWQGHTPFRYQSGNPNSHFRGHPRAALRVDNSEMTSFVLRLSQPGLAVKAGLIVALSRLAQDRRAERQNAMELKELKARAKLTTVTSASAAPAQHADPARCTKPMTAKYAFCTRLRFGVRGLQSTHGRLPETRRGRPA